jgi:hypothetical protein
MTRAQIEEQLKQWKVMVHDPKAFTPNCLCKFIWENQHGEDEWIFINDAQSIEDLIITIKCQMFIHKIESSEESDLIIDYR